MVRGSPLSSCSHCSLSTIFVRTDYKDTNPWWRVDLQTVFSITTVRILNKGMNMYGIVWRTEKYHF